MSKPVCNRSSVSHATSADSKYYRRVMLCLIATVVIFSSTSIIIPSARLYWTVGWIPVLCYFVWRYWIRLRVGGYFECDRCRKLKHSRHFMEYPDPDGVVHVWCATCFKDLLNITRNWRDVRRQVAGFLRTASSDVRRQVVRPYEPMPKPVLNPVPVNRQVAIIRHHPTPGPIIEVSDPKFATSRRL